MRNTLTFILLLLAAFLSAAVSPAENRTDIHATEHGKVRVEHIAEGLDHPWGMAMLPDGRLLVTERSGAMLLIDPAGNKTRKTLKGVPDVWASGQGGLLDVIADPDFISNQTIYFTFSDGGLLTGGGTAIASARLQENPEPALTDLKILYSMKPKTRTGYHFGSRIVMDKGGNLFFTIGDRGESDRAQDPFDPAGSVIRITRDGGIPADNPHADGKKSLPEIWSTGHRNPQGATLDEETGQLWTLAHGARGGDEINTPEAGKNYGWPVISYGKHYSGGKIGVGSSAPDYEQPVHYWDPSIAPSGLDFYSGDLFPQWQGNLFAGALKFRLLVRLEIAGGKVVHEERLFKGVYGRIRDVRSFPDGALWMLTDADNGRILRITPAQ